MFAGSCLAGLWALDCSFPPTIWVTSLGFQLKTEVVRSYRFFPQNSGFRSSFRTPGCPPWAEGVHKSGYTLGDGVREFGTDKCTWVVRTATARQLTY